MRNRLPMRSTHVSFAMSMCTFALLYCAVNIRPSFAQNNQGQNNNVDWRYHGNTLSNQRFQDVDQINPSNVAKLKPVWIFHTGVSDPNMSMEMTPVVIGGVMYVPTGDDDVYALNAATGKQIWAYHPNDMPPLSSLPICCNNDNRGVAVGNGKVFNARLDATLVALDQKTGKVVWKTTVDLPSNGASMTIAPQFVDNKVIVGVSGAEYDADTGKLIWKFWTTEPTTWSGDTHLHGGASVWGNPSYDPDLNMLYFTTGNAYPWPWAGDRAGTNLYSACIVAVDVRNGELKWYFQETHHDIWDFDGPQPTVLFDFNGIPALSHTSKTGFMFILDRRTGDSLYPYKEVSVPTTPPDAAFQHPWPTQPQSSIESLTEHSVELPLPAGYTAAPQWTTVQPSPLAFQPLFDGGMEWPPAAYSPRTHFIYSHARYVPFSFGVTDDPAKDANCPFNGTCTFTGTFFIPGQTNHGVYGAVDVLTGKVAWKVPVTPQPDSGVGVAGDLVFFGDSNGIFYAAHAATGKILWTFDSNTVPNAGGATASPAIYVVDGREYVVYGFGGNPGESPKLGDAVIAFALPNQDN
jgi:quinohemoprotein ethanol dehydrogenase